MFKEASTTGVTEGERADEVREKWKPGLLRTLEASERGFIFPGVRWEVISVFCAEKRVI